METASRPLVCARCGSNFECGRDSPAGCWCAAEPYRLPIPLPAEAGSFGDCLCPSCLQSVAEILAAARPSSA